MQKHKEELSGPASGSSGKKKEKRVNYEIFSSSIPENSVPDWMWWMGKERVPRFTPWAMEWIVVLTENRGRGTRLWWWLWG